MVEKVRARRGRGPQDLDAKPACGNLVSCSPEWVPVCVKGDPTGLGSHPWLGKPPAGRHAVLLLELLPKGVEVGALGPKVAGRGVGGLAVWAVGDVEWFAGGRAEEWASVAARRRGGGTAPPNGEEQSVGW